MPQLKLNGKTYSGSTNYASAISYTEDDGSKTTVQDKIEELNSNLNEQNKKFTSRSIAIRAIGICVENEILVPYILPIRFDNIPNVTIYNGAIAGVSIDTSTNVEIDETRTNVNEIVFKVTPNNGTTITNGTCYFCMINFTIS